MPRSTTTMAARVKRMRTEHTAVTSEKFWLLPIVLVLVLVGTLLVLTQGSVVAPFIYTLF